MGTVKLDVFGDTIVSSRCLACESWESTSMILSSNGLGCVISDMNLLPDPRPPRLRSCPSRRFDMAILCFSYTCRLHILFALTPAYVLLQNVQRSLGSSPSGQPSGPKALRSFFLAGHHHLGGSSCEG